jgi:uncharacterized radical SAM superfamily Fe-S cluster-containing enzyme
MSRLLSIEGPLLVFGGVYSNLHALRALFAEAERRGLGPANMLCTGDIAAYCADARPCLDLIRDSGMACIAGNCEEQFALAAADCGCGYAPGSACDTMAVQWFAHAAAQFDDDDRRWMAALPRRLDLQVGGLRLTAIHGALNAINRFVFPSTQWRVKLHDIESAGCDGILASHSGIPFSQVRGGRLWHNSGALGMPANDGTPRVWFSVITPGRESRRLDIEHVALGYDAQGAAQAMRAARLPEGYAAALTSGLWPSCDSMPADEVKATGRAIAPGRLRWRADGLQDAQWPAPENKPAAAVAKFADPLVTAAGETRASVTLDRLETLWINTGTLCNLACASCYIESTPRNDRLVYITAQEVTAYLDEIERDDLRTTTIGFTGGEPFLNPDMAAMMEDALSRGFEVIVLTNAMKPMRRFERRLIALNEQYRDRLTMRVSLDHYTQDLHELERGKRSWKPALDGLKWLAQNGFRIHVAGRAYSGEAEGIVRAGYGRLLAELGVDMDAGDPAQLVLFPEMDTSRDVPEITTACWGILDKSPADVMCSNSRMIVKRKGAAAPAVIACTLLPYDAQFELGATLRDAAKTVPLNHPFCAQFCVLGGAACKR